MPPILFLDYDGVLHPDDVYLECGQPVLHATGHLFMWAPLLEDALADYPDVRIVLSTSWARELRFARARDRLPQGLRSRVVGATWHSAMAGIDGSSLGRATWWDMATRYEQIKRHATRARLADWVAIDDNPQGWADGDRDKLLQTHSAVGISNPRILTRLGEHLARISHRTFDP